MRKGKAWRPGEEAPLSAPPPVRNKWTYKLCTVDEKGEGVETRRISTSVCTATCQKQMNIKTALLMRIGRARRPGGAAPVSAPPPVRNKWTNRLHCWWGKGWCGNQLDQLQYLHCHLSKTNEPLDYTVAEKREGVKTRWNSTSICTATCQKQINHKTRLLMR